MTDRVRVGICGESSPGNWDGAAALLLLVLAHGCHDHPGQIRDDGGRPEGGVPDGMPRADARPDGASGSGCLAAMTPTTTCPSDPLPCPGTCNAKGYCEAACPHGTEVRVPAGLVLMGNDLEPEPGRRSIVPEHLARLSRHFWIDKQEVTVEAYRACVEAGVCKEPDARVDTFCTYFAPGDLANFWRPLGLERGHPVNCVTWADATTFCAWKGGRLPTEAEWMLAAQGSADREGCEPGELGSCSQPLYPWGDDPDVFHHANQFGGGYAWSGWTTAPGGFFDDTHHPAYQTLDGRMHPEFDTFDGRSAFGLHDTLGNVLEWVSDWFDRTGYGPQDGIAVDPQGPMTGTERVLKSTSYMETDKLSVASRAGVDPARAWSASGIRCARSE